MRQADVRTLLEYNYQANRRILDAASRLTTEQFTAPTTLTVRSLRSTLVHALDVEWSWRVRCKGEPDDGELDEADYPTVAVLRQHWQQDEREMRAWVDSLSDADLAADFQLGRGEVIPLWYVIFHVVNHSVQQRSDAATLLTHLGHSPGDLDVLDVLLPPRT